MTQHQFAASLGIAQGFLCAIERGKKTPSTTLMIAIRHLYDIQLESPVSATAQTEHPSPGWGVYDQSEMKRVPFFKGRDLLSTTELINCKDFIAMPDLPENGFTIQHKGDFMAPTIRDGDIVIIDPEQKPAPGNVVLITGKWGESFLRRFRSKGGELYLTADNINYSPFKPDESTRILGVAIAAWRRINF